MAESPDSESRGLTRQLSAEGDRGLSPEGERRKKEKDKDKKKKKKKTKESDPEGAPAPVDQIEAPRILEYQPPPRELQGDLEVTGDLDEEDYEMLAGGEGYVNSREDIIEALQRRRRLREQAGMEAKGPITNPAFQPHEYPDASAPPERPVLIPHHEEEHAPAEWAPQPPVIQASPTTDRASSAQREEVYELQPVETQYVSSPPRYDAYKSSSPQYEPYVETSAPATSILRTSFVGGLPQSTAYTAPSPPLSPNSFISSGPAYSVSNAYATSAAPAVYSAGTAAYPSFSSNQSFGPARGMTPSYGSAGMGGYIAPQQGMGSMAPFGGMGMGYGRSGMGAGLGMGAGMGPAMGMGMGRPMSPMGMGMPMRAPMPFMGALSMMQPMMSTPVVMLMRKKHARRSGIPHINMSVEDLRDSMY